VTEPATSTARTRRATQSLVNTIHWCLHNPSILGYELLWRWAFGIPVLWIVLHQLFHLWSLIPQDTLVRLQAAEYDPVQASAILLVLAESLLPPMVAILQWLAPTFVVGWAIASGLGRWLVLRRTAALQPDLLRRPAASQPLPLVLFQLLRIAGMGLAVAAGFFCIQHAANIAFANTDSPNLVFYFAAVIVTGLGLFTAWALLSWSINVAPLLLVSEGLSFAAALRASLQLRRPLTGKLVEINLVLGIVKLAMLVLAMVFSAIPLPFESVTTPHQLHIWWLIVSVAYLVANAFFQVVRLVATLESLDYYRSHAALSA